MRNRDVGFAMLFFCFANTTDVFAAESGTIQGVYDSPLGHLVFSEKDGEVRGQIAAAGGPCKFPKGYVILEGTRLDDNITGTWKSCLQGKGCAAETSGWVMLLVTKSSTVLSGATHLDLSPGCQAPIPMETLSMRRVARQAAPPTPKSQSTSGRRQAQSTRVTPSANPVPPRKEAEAIANQAAALLEKGAIEAAREKFRAAVQADPQYSEGYVGVGVTFYMRDRYDEALEFYKKSLEANPGNRDAYYNTACVYALKGDKEQALRYLKIAVLNGYISLGTLSEDPDLKSLRDHPEFKQLQNGEF